MYVFILNVQFPFWYTFLLTPYRVTKMFAIYTFFNVRVDCLLQDEDKDVWNVARSAEIVDAFCMHLFPPVWSAKTWISPSWSSMADNAITQGGTGVLRTLFCICGLHPYTMTTKLHWCHYQLRQRTRAPTIFWLGMRWPHLYPSFLDGSQIYQYL